MSSRIVLASLVLSALAMLANAYFFGAQSVQPYLDQCIRRERAWVERVDECRSELNQCRTCVSADPKGCP